MRPRSAWTLFPVCTTYTPCRYLWMFNAPSSVCNVRWLWTGSCKKDVEYSEKTIALKKV